MKKIAYTFSNVDINWNKLIVPKYRLQVLFKYKRNLFARLYNVNDFVQFTGRLIYENKTLYMTVINTTVLQDKTLDSNLSNNALYYQHQQ